MVKLSTLAVGDEGVVVDIIAEEDTKLKIMEMGLTNREIIKVTKKSPLGDPLSIGVRGYELILRVAEAENILVNRITNG
ncbi:MAG: FeoA domain-containing protein [Rickettsiales bacterium]|nr:FeoA domain-containing protein [Rickettsiales bacterium]